MNIFRLRYKIGFITCILFFAFGTMLNAKDIQVVNITNNSANKVKDNIVEIPVSELKLGLGEYMATNEKLGISPIEIITDIKGKQFAVFCIPVIESKQTLKYTISKGSALEYPKRTYAELTHKIGGEFEGKEYIGGYSWVKPNQITLPGSFEDHSYYIKYEGPGWESDKVAYRFYLDNRNAIDVFAKKTTDIVLPGVGMDGFKNYHNMADWGMDNLRVGKALGLGSIAIWDGEKAVRVAVKDSTNCTITADGKLRSQVKTTYYGWQANDNKCNLTSLISIDAGTSASHIELQTDIAIDNITTGIIKQKEAKLYVNHDKNNKWSYIATFGKQSLNKDMQGLVVFARTKQIREITEDNLNHIIIINQDKNNYAEYFIMPTWELDVEPITTEEEFLECVNATLARLNNADSVSYKL